MKLKQLKKLYLLIFFLVFVFCLFPLTTKAQKASFNLRPAMGSFSVGSTFYVDVLISAEGIALNAAQATISFPADKLKVAELSKKSSIFTLWPNEPVFSNSEGKISFTGGLPTPGFIGESGKVFTILFQAKSQGQATLTFSGEIITANDPYGTNIFSSSQKGSYSIVAPSEYETPIEVPSEGEDKEPPLPFEITIDNEGDSTNPTPLLYFQTRDDQSGISHYELKIGDKEFIKVEKGKTTPFRIPLQVPGVYAIIAKAIDRAGNFTESKAEVRIESIAIPKITICPQVFKSGEEMMYTGGTALPDTKIIISLLREEELVKEWEVTSDVEGDWSLAKEGLFKSGNYKILVRAKDSRGAESYPSESCLFKIVLGGISIGPFIITYKSLTLFGSFLFIILLLLFIYLLYRIQRTRRIIEIEVLDLKKKFYKEYYELRIGIEKELKILRSIQTERELNNEERERQEELLKDLEDVERVIRIELKDIEEAK
jgi:hypothetical protein